jgi:BirA family transcriptional regulator, biotin operon repressor / biotin---[acetyl-CoA-carboxylase] ligase
MSIAMTDFNVHYVERIDSTNTRLLQWAATQDCHRVALVADEQTAGRGQRGRQWLAAPAEAVLCSVAWRFDRALALDGLSLAVGVILSEALGGDVDGAARDRLRLKWPNDLLIDESHKLGGILIETVASVGAARTAVIGVGINLKTPLLSLLPDALPGIGLDVWSGRVNPRDAVLHRFLGALAEGLDEFARRGFAAFQARWWARCAYLTRQVAVRLPDGEIVTGRLRSITERGALVIESERGLHTLVSGEVSLRVAST